MNRFFFRIPKFGEKNVTWISADENDVDPVSKFAIYQRAMCDSQNRPKIKRQIRVPLS